MERRMRWNAVFNEWKEAEDWQELKTSTKQFLMLMLLSVVFIIVIGIGAHLRHEIMNEHSMQGIQAVQVKESTLQAMLAEEMSYYQEHQQHEAFSLKSFGIWLFEKITNASLLDPAHLVTNELMYNSVKEKAVLVHGGIGSDPAVSPQDRHYSYEPTDSAYVDRLVGEVKGSDGVGEQPVETDEQAGGQGAPEDTITVPVEENTVEETATSGSGKDKPVAFIYHTHNRESWNAELSENDRDSQSTNKNITMVGQRLAEELEKLGVGAMVSDTDYPTAVPHYEWEYSYKYSRKTVKEALASNDELQYIFDLHRDSQDRKYTTAEINGESYAQVYFIIGQRNPNWKQNEAFARKLQDRLEEQYPGLSRGIWGKTANSGNAEYNQSLSSQSVLIEIGGIENTLEESYRTAKALAEVIAQIHNES